MKCTKCGMREATTEVLQRFNNHIDKMYLCDNCAKEYGSKAGISEFDLLEKMIAGSPMGLLSNFADMFNSVAAKPTVCPECKTTSDEFLKTGYVGCPECYKVFEPLVAETVKKLQQSDRHVGKTPVGAANVATEESRLRLELQAAIDAGNFAKAGELSQRLDMLVGRKKED